MPTDSPPFDFSGMDKLPKSDSFQISDDEHPPVDVAETSYDDPSDVFSVGERVALRELALLEARHGRMTREEAELHEWGIDPIIVSPKLEFPMTQLLRWSPEMVAAWILWREKEAVLRHFEPSYRDAIIWVQSGSFFSLATDPVVEEKRLPWNADQMNNRRPGYTPVRLGQTSLFSRFLDFNGHQQAFGPIEDWYPQLCGLLAEGILSARGTPLVQGAAKLDIPPAHWEDSRFEDSQQFGTILKVGGVARYRNISFSAQEITAEFSKSAGDGLAPGNLGQLDAEGLTGEYTEAEVVQSRHLEEKKMNGDTAASTSKVVPLINVQEVEHVLPWIVKQPKFHIHWHKPLFVLLKIQCPQGFPLIDGPKKNRYALMWEFLSKAVPFEKAKSIQLGKQTFTYNRNFEQAIERYLNRRFQADKQPVNEGFGHNMAEAIKCIR